MDEGGKARVFVLAPMLSVLDGRHVEFEGVVYRPLTFDLSEAILILYLLERALSVEVVRIKSREDRVVEDAGELFVVIKGMDGRGHLVEVILVVGVEVESVERVVVVNRVEEDESINVALDRVVVNSRVEFVPRVDLSSVHESGLLLGRHGLLSHELDELSLLI